MLALVDGVPRLLGLVQALDGLRRAPGRSRHPPERVPAAARRATARTSSRACCKALDMIDAIIALIRGSESADAAKQALHGRAVRVQRDAGHPHPRHAAAPARRARAPEAARRVRRAAGDDRRARVDPRRRAEAARRHQGRARRGPRQVRRRAPHARSPPTPASSPTSTSSRTRSSSSCCRTRATSRPCRSTQFRVQGRGGKGVRGGNLRDEDYVEHLLTTTAHSYLLFFSNRGRVYRLRAHEIPMKDRTARGTALVNLVALAARRAHRSGHRHAHLRRRRVPVLRDAQRHGEEDADVGVRLVAAHRAHRDQPQRRRRARAGDPDVGHRRRVHGVAPGHDDPLLRGRRAADGPGDRRRARHEAEEHRRRRGELRRRPRRGRAAVRVVERSRQAHPARRLQPPGPGRPGRAGHAGHRGTRRGGRRRSPSRRATRSSCSPRPATSSGWVSTRSPSRAGTRPACESPGSPKARPLWPWPGCSKASTTEAEGGEES